MAEQGARSGVLSLPVHKLGVGTTVQVFPVPGDRDRVRLVHWWLPDGGVVVERAAVLLDGDHPTAAEALQLLSDHVAGLPDLPDGAPLRKALTCIQVELERLRKPSRTTG